MPKTICLDFDGVLNTYDGWKGEDFLFDPRPGAGDFIKELLSLGFQVIIHSTRDPLKITDWLLDHKFPGAEIIRVTREKPPAIAYVDDRASCCIGDFALALDQVKNCQTYWEDPIPIPH